MPNISKEEIEKKESKKHISPQQEMIKRQILYGFIERNNLKITNDDGQYLAFDNGKRFYKLNFDDCITYFGIREDGDTRTAFNGIIKRYDDFIKIEELTNF